MTLTPANATTYVYDDYNELVQPILLEFCTAFQILEGGFILCGNALTLYAISRFTSLQTTSNILIIHLAVADLLGFPTIVMYILQDFDFGLTDTWKLLVCRICIFLVHITAYGNSFVILLIGYERCLYILYPLKYDIYITKCRLKCFMGIMWLVVAVLSVTNSYQIDSVVNGCISSFYQEDSKQVFSASICFFQYINLIGTYSIIFYVASKKCTKTVAPYSIIQKAQSNGIKILKMGMCILGVFIGCTLPFYIAVFLVIFGVIHIDNLIRYSPLLRTLWCMNYWIDPLIYCWRMPEFRKAFHKLLLRK